MWIPEERQVSFPLYHQTVSNHLSKRKFSETLQVSSFELMMETLLEYVCVFYSFSAIARS